MIRYFLVALVVLGLDQWSKWVVVNKMTLLETIPVINGFFYLISHRNEGAAFGILQGQKWLFVAITFFVLGVISYYLWKLKRENTLMSLAFSLIFGGALGNLVDRISSGAVVDFLLFQFGRYHFPVFNLADSAIVIGVALLLYSTFTQPGSSSKKLLQGARES